MGGLVARGKGWPKDKAYFNLGAWGWPVNIIAFVYGVFMIINLSWPRTPTAKWYDNYIVAVSLGVVVVVGIIVYVIQRARGVDLSATIHEIGESPVDAQAALAMAAGEAGKVLPGELGHQHDVIGPARTSGGRRLAVVTRAIRGACEGRGGASRPAPRHGGDGLTAGPAGRCTRIDRA